MTSDWERAKAIAGFVGLLGVAPTVLWMTGNLGEVSTAKMVEAATNVIVSLAEPAIVLTVVIALVLKFVKVAPKIEA